MKIPRTLGSERGAALVTGLVLLLVLTLLGVAALQGTTLQERMAGNLEQQELSLQAAEAGLRDAEAWLRNTEPLPPFDGTGGCYMPPAPGAQPHWQQPATWTDANNYLLYQASDLGDPPPFPLPRYIVEFLAPVDIDADDSKKFAAESEDPPSAYRISSRGASPNGRAVVILQATFIR